MSASKSSRAEAWLAALAASVASATPACAHGFGQRYELPLPLGLYLFGAAAVVALSFVAFGLFVRRRAGPSREVALPALSAVLGHPFVTLPLRLVVLALFLVTIAAGLVGDQNAYRNIAPTLVWIVWWVGFAFVSAFVGDLWALVNPWRTIHDGAQRLLRWRSPRLAYPEWLGVWPACLLLLAFAWIELVDPSAASPWHIAWLAIAYSALTLAGMAAFGRDAWLRHGEAFALVFGTFGRFAPFAAKDGRLVLRSFGAGLLDDARVSPSMVAFVLLLLAAVLYDGLIGTGEWALFEAALRERLPDLSDMALRTAGLIGFWLLFLVAYLLICAIMSLAAGGAPPTSEFTRRFVLTLVPIAIGYHVAHYLVFLLIQGQYIIPLLSDPFGRGWDLIGTAGYRVDIAVAGARFAWYAALAAIVAGHVFAVYLAHLKAIALLPSARAALASQVPLTALMVVYTFVGLSIMAEPIVERRLAAEPAAVAAQSVPIPEDAVLPDAQSGELRPVGPDRTARSKLVYKVLGSAFHDGTKTTGADLLYAYAFAYRWSGHDPVVRDATATLRRYLMGVRVVGVDAASKSFRVGDVNFVREVLTVEVYLSAPPEEPEWSAALAPPWSTVPWTVLALMEEALQRGLAASFSRLDLARDGALNEKLAALVAQFEREAFRPAALSAEVGEAEARRRWAALAAFRKSHGHFLVTNGPYRLKSFAAQSVMLEAFRDLTYPLGVGSYDAYAVPRRGFITAVERDGMRLNVTGEIETVEKFQRSHRLVRSPLRSIPAAFLQRAAPECRYVVLDAEGNVAAAGSVPLGEGAAFRLDLTGRLPPGRYALSALIAVNGNVMNAELHRMPLVIEP